MDEQPPNYRREFLTSPQHVGLGLLTIGLGFISAQLLPLIIGGTLAAQSKGGDRLTVPLSDPSRPAFLKVGIISGGITVRGTSGKEVIVQGNVRTEEGGDKLRPVQVGVSELGL